MSDIYEQGTYEIDELLNEYHEKKLCGGAPSCASCRQDEKDKETDAWNKAFDEQLWTFIAVREDGTESVLYGHATNNVFIHALAKADKENSSLKVVKYVGNFKCDYSRCEGHNTEHGYCSAIRMYEDMMDSNA